MKYIALIVALCVAGTASADWRMDKFDLNNDGVIKRGELLQAGCGPKALNGLFDHADKNNDGVLNQKEARKASFLIFKPHCPKNVVVKNIRG